TMKTRITIKGLEKASSILFFALSMIVLTAPALAQGTASAALGGAVSDKNGARIKGATVTVTNKGTGQSRTVATDDNGEYKIDFLPAGRYDLKVTASGFGDATSGDLELLVGK